MPSEWLLLIVPVGAFLAAIVAGTTGFGDALVASMIWLMVLEPIAVTPLVVSIGLVIHLAPLIAMRHALKPRRILPFLVPGLAGVPLGVWTVGSVDGDVVRRAVGVILLLQAAWVMVQWRRGAAARRILWGGRVADGGIGLAGGFLGGLSGLSGILPTLWCGLRGWTPIDQRAVYQSFIFFMHGAALCWLAARGAVGVETGRLFLICLPATVLGLAMGLTVFRRLNAAMFKLLVQALMAVAGVVLLI